MQSTDSLADVRIAPLEFVYVARGDLLICNSIVDLPAWDFDVGRRVLKRFWSSILELPAWCFEVGTGAFWVEKCSRGAHF